MNNYVDGRFTERSNINWAIRYMSLYAGKKGYTITKYNGKNYNFDKYDSEIVAWSYYWNAKLDLINQSSIMPDLVKAMIMAESDGGKTSQNDPMQVFNAGDPASYTMARIGENYQYPNDGRIPKDGYVAVKNVFTDGKPDAEKVDSRLSIAFGTRWLGHKIQNAGGDRAQGVTDYNGGGFNSTHGIDAKRGDKENDGYLKYIRNIMANPSDYINGKIPKK